MASLSYVYSGGYNSFIPTVNQEAGMALSVEFSRSPDKFKLNKYTQLQPVSIESGKYWRWDQNAMARTNTGDGSQFIWADNADRPAPNVFQGLQLPAYNCTRLNFGFQLGDLATYHAQKAGGVDMTAVNSRTAAGIAMVQRTRKALVAAQNTSIMQYINLKTIAYSGGTGGSNSSISAGGGNWSPMFNSTTIPSGLVAGNYWDTGKIPAAGSANGGVTGTTYMRSGVNSIVALIVANSNAQVQAKDICMVMGPDTAIALAQSAEILDFIKQCTDAKINLAQDEQWNMYGIPSQLFGVRVEIEDTSYISSHGLGSNTAVRSWVLPYGTIIFLSRPGSIDGSPYSYSTLMGFFLEEMTVEVYDEAKHRYTQGNVVENYDYQITAPITGFLVQEALSGS